MFTKHIESLIARLEKLEVELRMGHFDSNAHKKLESEMYEIERKLNEFPYHENQTLLKKAGRIVSRIKKENDFDKDFDDDFD